MALPLIGFVGLLLLAIIFFVLGVSRFNVNASLGFMAFAGVILIVSSMLVMNEGLQLDSVESFTDSGSVTSVSYQEVSYGSDYNWLKVLIDTIFWSGFVVIIVGFAYNFRRAKSRQVDEWAI
jgi:hypothetical protein